MTLHGKWWKTNGSAVSEVAVRLENFWPGWDLLTHHSTPHFHLSYKDTEAKWKRELLDVRQLSEASIPVPWHPSSGLWPQPQTGWETNKAQCDTSKSKLPPHLTKPKPNYMACYSPASVAGASLKTKVLLHVIRTSILYQGGYLSLGQCSFPHQDMFSMQKYYKRQ